MLPRKPARTYQKKCAIESCPNWFATQYNQTKYCRSCAKAVKLGADERTRDDLKLKNKKAQEKFRKKHPGISTPYVRRHRERKRQQLQANTVGLVSAPLNHCQSGDTA